MDSNEAEEIGHDLEAYGYDKSVDNGARWFADPEEPIFDGPQKKSAQEELNLNTENSGE